MEAAVFGALGEPSRLRIVDLLRSGPMSVGEIADRLGLRQPQTSKHLRVLTETGLVAPERSARHRIYHLEAVRFVAIAEWVDSFEHLWEVRMDRLGSFLDATRPESPESPESVDQPDRPD